MLRALKCIYNLCSTPLFVIKSGVNIIITIKDKYSKCVLAEQWCSGFNWSHLLIFVKAIIYLKPGQFSKNVFSEIEFERYIRRCLEC